ncbi:MAG: hypothetical protein WB689_27465 [Xanthobacteraceae bacterium]
MTDKLLKVSRVLLAGMATALLASCATRAQIEAYGIANTARDVQKKVLGCFAKIEAKPEYALLYKKVAFSTIQDPDRMPSQAQLADAEKVSDDAVALGLNFYAEAQDCNIEGIESLSGVAPEFWPLFIDFQRNRIDLINEIVATKPSYGHINERLRDFKLREREAAIQAAQAIKIRLVAQHELELEDRQVVAEQVAQLALDVATTLATRQVNLIRTQRAFAAAYPRYQLQKIRVVKCNPVAGATNAAIATIKARYAALGLSGSTMEAQAIADAQNRSVAISCQLV